MIFQSIILLLIYRKELDDVFKFYRYLLYYVGVLEASEHIEFLECQVSFFFVRDGVDLLDENEFPGVTI